jgi:hypothetical protein
MHVAYTGFDKGEKLEASTCMSKKILLLAIVLYALTGCATLYSSQTDVSSPSSQEFTEFDALVNVPVHIAYQNILNKAPSCWCSPFSGQIIAQADPNGFGTSRISFVVPGKFLGSKVELATVRLYPQEGNHTRIVGSSFAFPGTWRMTELADWANAASEACTDSTSTIATTGR